MSLLKFTSRSISLAGNVRCPSIKFRYGVLAKQNEAAANELPQTLDFHSPTQSEEIAYSYELPLRFQRQPLSEEEIDCINTGGAGDASQA